MTGMECAEAFELYDWLVEVPRNFRLLVRIGNETESLYEEKLRGCGCLLMQSFMRIEMWVKL